MFCYLVTWITFSRAEQNISHKSIHKTIICLYYIKESGSSCRAEAALARSRKRSFFGR